jgi:hypothetical protein
MRDRHQTEVSHHQARIDREAEAHETEQESREAYAKTVDWTEQLRGWNDYRLSAVFDTLVCEVTDWIPYPDWGTAIGRNGALLNALKELRDHQAELARQHFLDTGEME